MKSLTERMDLARIVLYELSRQPLGRSELEKRTVTKAGTHAAFESIFRYLIQGGYIKKSSIEYRAKYLITEKGSKFLEVI
jgi:DNA-binding PadR family transcriptional regulator